MQWQSPDNAHNEKRLHIDPYCNTPTKTANNQVNSQTNNKLTCTPSDIEESTPLHSIVLSIHLHMSFIFSPHSSILDGICFIFTTWSAPSRLARASRFSDMSEINGAQILRLHTCSCMLHVSKLTAINYHRNMRLVIIIKRQ